MKIQIAPNLEVEMHELLTFTQLAQVLSVSIMTLYNWKRDRGLPFVMININHQRPLVRFYLPQVRAWQQSQEFVKYQSSRRLRFKRYYSQKGKEAYKAAAAA